MLVKISLDPPARPNQLPISCKQIGSFSLWQHIFARVVSDVAGLWVPDARFAGNVSVVHAEHAELFVPGRATFARNFVVLRTGFF